MQKILEHMNLIKKLKECQVDLNFIKEFSLEKLMRCCNNLENKKVPSELYLERKVIQKELIRDEGFAEYLTKMVSKDITLEKIENLILAIQGKNKKVRNYDIDILIKLLQNESFNDDIYYDYLEYFRNEADNIGKQDIIAANLSYFHSQSQITMDELSQDERDLFILPFMSDYNLIPIEDIKRVCELLVQNKELKELIHFLFSHKLTIPLNIGSYELINKDSRNIYEYICKIEKIINNEQMYQLLLRWLNNGCTIYDLKILENRLNGLDKAKLDKIFCNRSSYINFIFGDKLCNFPLEYISGEKEKILIYAITNNKKSFLKLIEENTEKFLNMSNISVLFNEEFYSKYININTLTLKNLIDLQTMTFCRTTINHLKVMNYTFEEIKLLCYADEPYLEMYNNLLDMKVDDRMLIIKQLMKRQLLNGINISNGEIKNLAKKLKEKHLYQWMESEFAHIKGINPQNVVNILIKYDSIKKFIPQISNQKELAYVIRNIDKVQKYKNLLEVKQNIQGIDEYWWELVTYMKLTNEFINENEEHIKNFLLNNGAELAISYYKGCSSNNEEAFKRIVKAELMGEFKTLKYFTDDLKREIDFNLKDYQIKEWTTNNMKIKEDNIEVMEYDDFYNTMVLGEMPARTCLSYKNGAYNQCLLACFDSNKKILYAKINDKVVARAMVRLTKGKYYKTEVKTEQKFSFVDLENLPDRNKEEKTTANEEYLTIFLEKIYTSGISKEQEIEIERLFIKLLESKTIRMNATLVLSKYYSDTKVQAYIATRYYMYISKSKASAQYLDSLLGQATIESEGQYRENNFLIWQPNLEGVIKN